MGQYSFKLPDVGEGTAEAEIAEWRVRSASGQNPSRAGSSDIEVITSQFPFAANGRALSMEAAESGGFVRVVARKHDRRLLGIQAVRAHVYELSGEFALALEMGATLADRRCDSRASDVVRGGLRGLARGPRARVACVKKGEGGERDEQRRSR